MLGKILRLREASDLMQLKDGTEDEETLQLHGRQQVQFHSIYLIALSPSFVSLIPKFRNHCRQANGLRKHADAMEQHYDNMSMLKATAAIRVTPKLLSYIDKVCMQLHVSEPVHDHMVFACSG